MSRRRTYQAPPPDPFLLLLGLTLVAFELAAAFWLALLLLTGAHNG